MIKLTYSEHLRRRIRQDDISDLSIPTWNLLREAILAKKTKEALELLADGKVGAKDMHDNFRAEIAYLLAYMADTFGEEEIGKYWRRVEEPGSRNWMAQKYTPELEAQIDAEQQRQHQGIFTAVEEEDRYVITYDPCGSGGKARKDRIGGVTKKPYPWSWGKAGVPYYCLHCCANWEIIPIELRGYPIRITDLGDTPEDPCVHIFYKKPELIPEKYFTRVGKTKTLK